MFSQTGKEWKTILSVIRHFVLIRCLQLFGELSLDRLSVEAEDCRAGFPAEAESLTELFSGHTAFTVAQDQVPLDIVKGEGEHRNTSTLLKFENISNNTWSECVKLCVP